MNQKILITDFLQRLRFRVVQSTVQPFSLSHTAIALVTRLPRNIPTGKQVYLNLVQDGKSDYLVQFDIEPVPATPDWFLSLMILLFELLCLE